MPTPFHESPPGATPIRDLNLTIAGSPLEPILDEFVRELEAAGIRRVRPRFYLSTEWGVPEGTVAIEQGHALGRPSRIQVTIAGTRVTITGSGLLVADGVLHL